MRRDECWCPNPTARTSWTWWTTTRRGGRRHSGVDTDTAGGDKNTAGKTAAASEPRLVVDSGDNGAAVLDARLSPDGRWVAFVRECEIRVAPCDRVDGDDRDEATDRDVASGISAR